MKALMNFDDIFSLRIKQEVPKVGDVLLSEPLMSDPFFSRSSVILASVSHGAALGIVLNRKIGFNLQDVVSGFQSAPPIPLYCGGPVSLESIVVLHTLGGVIPNSEEICSGIFMKGDLRVIRAYIESGEPIEGRLRFFVGFSSWRISQLADELNKRYSWAVLKNCCLESDELLCGYGDEYWRKMVGLLDNRYESWLNCPVAPELN